MNSDLGHVLQARGHLSASVQPMSKAELDGVVRKLTHRSCGFVTSRKNGASLPWRARGERDLMRLFELDHGIVSYAALSDRVEFILDGRSYKAVPAVDAWTIRGRMVFDVLRTENASPARKAIIDALKDIYANRGVRYRCLRPSEVLVEPRMTNVTYARSFKDVSADAPTRLRLLELVSAGDRTWTVDGLRNALGEKANGLFDMAMRRELRLDLSARQPADMVVTLGEGF